MKPSLSACSTRASRSARKSTFCTSGALPGKTIVFAMSKDHAGRIREVFEEMFPQYSQNNGATISWPVEHLLEEFDMTRRPLLFCRGAILLAACRAEPTFNSPCRRSQTLRRDAALVSRPKEQATRPRVLLMGCGDFRSPIRSSPDWPLCQSFASLPETAAGRGYIGNAILRVDLRWYPLLDHSCHRSIHGCKQRIVRSAKPG